MERQVKEIRVMVNGIEETINPNKIKQDFIMERLKEDAELKTKMQERINDYIKEKEKEPTFLTIKAWYKELANLDKGVKPKSFAMRILDL